MREIYSFELMICNLCLTVCLACSLWYNVYQHRIINSVFEKCGTSTVFDEAKINSMFDTLEEDSEK